MFVVRLNPDPRDGWPYSKYVSEEEYKTIHDASPMDGFHEAVNFLAESGVVRGYLPPRHSSSMRTGEPFVLLTITAKTAKVGGDKIVGIQTGCVYVGETMRQGARHKQGLTWHYRCPASLSYLFPEPIPYAREVILGTNGSWVRGPTYEVAPTSARQRIVRAISVSLGNVESKKRFEALLQNVDPRSNSAELESDATFERDVAEAIRKPLHNVKGNERPVQKEVWTYQYVRDPKVVAFVLKSANGICFDCKKKGPFISKITGLPYLEVHHVHMLKNGGRDTTDNAVALCPNCHRARHYG